MRSFRSHGQYQDRNMSKRKWLELCILGLLVTLLIPLTISIPDRITPPAPVTHQVHRSFSNGQWTGLHRENTKPSYTESQVNELKRRLKVDCDGGHHELCLDDVKESYKVALSRFGVASKQAMWFANAIKTVEAQDRA